MHNRRHWDIFCKVVDNFGDIGVCWRLSRQLANEYPLQVRLLIDDLATAGKIIPNLDASQSQQNIHGVEVCHWHAPHIQPANVVLETFGCGLPDAYLQQMRAEETIWINIDYLSAEPWVSDFHTLPSRHPTLPLTKHFFFPGFSENTGGLIREQNLLARRDDFLSSAQQQKEFWQKLGLEKSAPQSAIKISLFCYPQADARRLLSALASGNQRIQIILPEGNLNALATDFNAGNTNLKLHIIPFLSQAEYDRLLWACDLNFVRGEDSWIRAIWAGKPFIWQPYIQTEFTHIKKLDAFLQTYTAHAAPELKSALYAAHHDWSDFSQENHADFNPWQPLIEQLPAWHRYAAQQSNRLAAQTDLAANLVIFSDNLLKK